MTRRGFTLMEVLLAIALSGALLSAMFAFLWDMLSTRERVISAAGQRRAAAVLVERLERDLVTCIAGDGVLGSGVTGDDHGITVLTRDVPVRLAMRGPEDGGILADLERSEYRFTPGNGTLAARRVLAFPGDRVGTRAAFEQLGTGIHLVRFRYHDGRGWRDEYDSRADGGLPVAVEVAVWFDAWAGAEIVEPGDELDDELDPGGRRTFDADAGFDEDAFAELSDLEDLGEPVPDRVRVILVPDAGDEPGAAAVEDEW
ncbi:MAG: prepilin-type N-terminal cleavage/methylation domain-containing protein [Planctomycetes bacterium]|nr:prepilin-type N-terminal cleavage/methylation domain-containing protein [Planctomycetota bacterium]